MDEVLCAACTGSSSSSTEGAFRLTAAASTRPVGRCRGAAAAAAGVCLPAAGARIQRRTHRPVCRCSKMNSALRACATGLVCGASCWQASQAAQQALLLAANRAGGLGVLLRAGVDQPVRSHVKCLCYPPKGTCAVASLEQNAGQGWKCFVQLSIQHLHQCRGLMLLLQEVCHLWYLAAAARLAGAWGRHSRDVLA